MFYGWSILASADWWRVPTSVLSIVFYGFVRFWGCSKFGNWFHGLCFVRFRSDFWTSSWRCWMILTKDSNCFDSVDFLQSNLWDGFSHLGVALGMYWHDLAMHSKVCTLIYLFNLNWYWSFLCWLRIIQLLIFIKCLFLGPFFLLLLLVQFGSPLLNAEMLAVVPELQGCSLLLSCRYPFSTVLIFLVDMVPFCGGLN